MCVDMCRHTHVMCVHMSVDTHECGHVTRRKRQTFVYECGYVYI